MPYPLHTMTRDRLGELLTVRNKNVVTVDIENSAPETRDKNLKKTFEKATVLGQLIATIEKNIYAVRHMTQDDLITNRKDLDDRIESMFVNNTSICVKINRKLRDFAEELKTVKVNSADGRMKFVQYNTLRMRYMKIFKQNNEELENFRNIQKSNLKAQLRARGVELSDQELATILEEKPDLKIFTENIIETPATEGTLAEIEKQYRQCLKIGQTLNEVGDLFINVAILVDAQQDVVDRIEYQTQLAKEFVENTPSVLEESARKKTRQLTCKIYSGIAITVMVIIIMIPLLKYLINRK